MIFPIIAVSIIFLFIQYGVLSDEMGDCFKNSKLNSFIWCPLGLWIFLIGGSIMLLILTPFEVFAKMKTEFQNKKKNASDTTPES